MPKEREEENQLGSDVDSSESDAERFNYAQSRSDVNCYDPSIGKNVSTANNAKQQVVNEQVERVRKIDFVARDRLLDLWS